MKLPVTLFFNPTRQPNIFARSPTIAVNNPIIPRDTKKHGHPPNKPAGGINANMIYQIVKYKKSLVCCQITHYYPSIPYICHKTYLESKSQKVHNVVGCTGILNIPTIYVHRILKLLSPRLVLYPHFIYVCVCQDQHPT